MLAGPLLLRHKAIIADNVNGPMVGDHVVAEGICQDARECKTSLTRLDAFERCGESFDTVISAKPTNYAGSPEALRSARNAAEEFARSLFERIEFIRGELQADEEER